MTSIYNSYIPSQSPNLKVIDTQMSVLERTKSRIQKQLTTLEGYLDNVDTEHTNVEQLGGVLSLYEEETSKLQKRLVEVNDQHEALVQRRKADLDRYPITESKTVGCVSVGVFVPQSASLQLALIYGSLPLS